MPMYGKEIRWALQEIALRPITLTLMGMGVPFIYS
jgi:hypothetical protein